MRGLHLVSLTLVLPLAAACAHGDTGGISGSGESSSSTEPTGGQGGATGAGGQDGGSSTSSSGGVPTTCAAAHGSIGCCDGDAVYYCKSGETTLTVTSCSGSKVCGWNGSSSYYACVAAPGGPDPSNANPEACN